MSWRGEAGGIEAAGMKHPVVMSPGKPLYFDHYQSDKPGEPLAIGGLNTLENVYNYHPLPAGLSEETQKYILGAQANLWTEYIATASHLEYMAFPRALALAEACWLGKDKKNYVSFLSRLDAHRNILKGLGVNFREWK
jgi:hexosaminidase